MATAALVFYAVFLTITLGVRVAIQVVRTGSTGFYGPTASVGTSEWYSEVLYIIGIFAAPLAPILDLLGVIEPIGALDTAFFQALGIVIAVVGTLLIFAAQVAMGDSWRIGVEPEERTPLVTSGLFAVVRNPIYAVTIPTLIGPALMVPSIVGLADLAILWLALVLQVRVIEEPYLLRAHGAAYRDYAARVGRFLPGVGLLPATPDA